MSKFLKSLALSLLVGQVLLGPLSIVQAQEDSDAAEETTSQEAVVFMDDMGREFQIDSTPQRIVTLSSDMFRLVSELGGPIVGTIEPSSGEYPEITEDMLNLGSASEVNVESVVGLEPDLVLASIRFGTNKIDIMDETGIMMPLFNVATYEDFQRVTQIIGQILGQEQVAQDKLTELQTRIDQVLANVPDDAETAKIAILNVNPRNISLQKQGTTAVEIASYFDVENAASELDTEEEGATSVPLSMEVLVDQQPDFLFLVFHGDPNRSQEIIQTELEGNEAWASLEAVANEQVYTLGSDHFLSNPLFEFDQALATFASYLYPDVDFGIAE